MELGGNAPLIVFEDADLDRAIEGTIASKFRNTGQTCVCANRIYVHDAVFDDFAAKLATRVKAMKIGAGLTGQTDLGPLISAAALTKVEHHVADAIGKGAHLILGGQRATALGPGAFYMPTILENAGPSMRLAHEETFGPVAPLFRFWNEEEVIAAANDSDTGLASYLFTRDLGRFWRVSEALEVGIVGANTGLISTEVAPFGGVKESGLGREGSKYGIEEFLETKYLCISGL
jgi:succinate-semialdehyde dehydrogenase/glutarate-semialdehyde dehydrogenase